MSNIEIPLHLRAKLGAEMKMDVHWIDVRLKDGRAIYRLAVRGGRYITGFADACDGESALSFAAEDIINLRRTARRYWPFW